MHSLKYSCALLGLGALLLTSSAAAAQHNANPMPNAMAPDPGRHSELGGRKLYRYVEQMPVYLDGGKAGLQAFIGSRVRGAASGSGAYLTFVVDQTGKPRFPALGPASADSEAATDPALARAFQLMGSFRPGYQNGKPVDVELTIPLAKPTSK
ncbi:hypothetical protein D3Y59_12310 [Hymenobacter oligotrophus]|uniref:TonB C-terminal domain-containing protein n=1 Tax=Hymenobacter oligotrophus TaxID=2319843 RepID=A0A3B7R9K0_9BACT|nr:hypothetical protein [Hymenobacter oligotrophus]AYA37761.1 hypothetical protein D3Y59_12310 [Hymenobacter oligotrophus]